MKDKTWEELKNQELVALLLKHGPPERWSWPADIWSSGDLRPCKPGCPLRHVHRHTVEDDVDRDLGALEGQ